MRAESDPVEASHIVDRRAQADRPGDVRCSGFEAFRQPLVRRFLKRHAPDHRTAALPRGESLEESLPAIEHADSGRSVEFMAAQRVEVRAQVLDVYGEVSDGLRAIDDHDGSALMCEENDLLDRQHRPERVRDMRDRDDPCPFGKFRADRIERNFSAIRHFGDDEARSLFRADHLPRNDVRMVLEPGDEHFIPRAEFCASERLRHQIERFRRSPDEHDLGRLARVQERPDLFSGGFECQRRALGQLVNTPMHICRIEGHRARHRVDDRSWFERRRGTIEINQAFPVDLLREGRELPSRRRHVEHGCT